MTLCPVCNAPLDDSRECRRCKTDLGKIFDIKQESILHRQTAVEAFEKDCFHEMFLHARRSFTLLQTPEAARLLACAAILINKFDLGYCLWEKYRICE